MATEMRSRRWTSTLARAGLATRGGLYAVVAILALQVARGSPGEEADREGAIRATAQQPAGKVVLVLVAVGLAGYALWRLLRAVTGSDDSGDDAGPAKRAADLGRAAIYAGGFISAAALLTGNGGGGNDQQQAWTARVMSWPFGRWLVAAAGVAVVGAGLWNWYRAATGRYRDDLKTFEMPFDRGWGNTLAAAGLIGRGLVFVFVGAFVVRAAARFDPAQATGLDVALRQTVATSYGPWVVAAVAVGLALFAAYSFLEAGYRRVLGS